VSYLLEICPRCEEAILVRKEVPQDIDVSGTVMRIPKVQVEECRHCGFRSLTGKEVRLFDVLFAPQYADPGELVKALKTAGYVGMFLREDRTESSLAFGSRQYVDTLEKNLQELYLDNESSHVIQDLMRRTDGSVALDLVKRRCTVKLPKVGEGENGVVFDYAEDAASVLKLAKPRPYSRDHVRLECELTELFAGHSIPVPRVFDWDPHGSFCFKERLAGKSLAAVYYELGGPDEPRHRAARDAVQRFIAELLELFVKHPEAKTSMSPNNIFVVLDGDSCRCLLVDTGPAPLHDYSHFSFAEYWEKVIPQKIEQYRQVGYL
jgi:hypothetical protein